MPQLWNQTQNICLAKNVVVASTLKERMTGLLSRKDYPLDQTLWIRNCNSIHTVFMKFAIDAVFVDRNLCVKSITRDLRPHRLIFPIWGASSVFEFMGHPSRTLPVNVGDRLNVVD